MNKYMFFIGIRLAIVYDDKGNRFLESHAKSNKSWKNSTSLPTKR